MKTTRTTTFLFMASVMLLFSISILKAQWPEPASGQSNQGFLPDSESVAGGQTKTGDILVATFDDLELDPESYWNGSDGSGGFISGPVRFYNNYNPDWYTWSGWAFSSMNDTLTPGWTNQYSAITGEGVHPEGGVNYGVSYVSAASGIVFTDGSAHDLTGVYVTNTTYAALAMRDGDAFSKKFGGIDGTDPDWFLLTVEGYRDGVSVGSVSHYLADYRSDLPAEDTISETWEWLGLTGLGKVDSLSFSLSSSDVGDWGMNTPGYFAMDDLTVLEDLPPEAGGTIQDFTGLTGETTRLDLSTLFTDPDDPDDDITLQVTGSNEQVATTAIRGDSLIISLLAPGTSEITLRALSNNKEADIQFEVTVIPDRYIAEVLQYVPAPGQFINTASGSPDASASITGGITGTLSLGAFGGSVVFRFHAPVENHPDHPFGVDFTIFGNAMPQWSEPGVVSVMKDENQNGLPDDTWYELAGSDHFFTTTRTNHQVTYTNPGGTGAADIVWRDSNGNTGVIPASNYNDQSGYPSAALFPGIDPEEYTLAGTMLESTVDISDPASLNADPRAFGYADNRVRGQAPYDLPDNPYTPETENAGGDPFDISWAVDETGSYADLDMIHFVRVSTAVLDSADWLGEVSTEIAGAMTVSPRTGISGESDVIVVRPIPDTIRGNQYQFEALLFSGGRRQDSEALTWSVSLPGAVVNDAGLLTFDTSGELTVTVSMTSRPEITASIRTVLEYSVSSNGKGFTSKHFGVYPNPATEYFMVDCDGPAQLSVYSLDGSRMVHIPFYEPGTPVRLDGLSNGIYLVRILWNGREDTSKLVVHQ